jgi:hypothetical protein
MGDGRWEMGHKRNSHLHVLAVPTFPVSTAISLWCTECVRCEWTMHEWVRNGSDKSRMQPGAGECLAIEKGSWEVAVVNRMLVTKVVEWLEGATWRCGSLEL